VLDYFLLKNLFAGVALSGLDLIPRFYACRRSGEGRRASKLGPLLLLLLPFALPVRAQEFVPERVVFPITDFKPDIKYLAPVAIKFGTGFCLDQDCRFVGTNYHVAKAMGTYVRIEGVFSAHRYLDSDPHDAEAQEIKLAGVGSLRFNPAHDLAIYEMRHPLKHFHGIGFSDDLESSSEVDIYTYPLNWNPKRKLVRWRGRFVGETSQGLLAFSYEEGRLRGGASGGIVVDSKTKKIVGILSALPEGKDRIALAVPIKELSNFVSSAQPYLQATLFPKTVFVSPVAVDLYPPYIWPRAAGLSQRPVETPEVIKLRRTAQHLADSMRNFTATETFAWGRDNREPELTDAYETLIVDGWQRWRRLGDKRLYENVPSPPLNASIVSGAEWSVLPQMVGTELNLKIHQAPDAVVGGRTIHVFQYAANIEDKVCTFKSVMYFGFFLRSTTKFYDCHGEVWMDESGIILRISDAVDLSGPWYRWWGVMTYGWLEKNGAQYLVPITIATQAENKKTYWCRGLFTDYEMFGVKSRIVLSKAERAREPSLGEQ
jgi:hypothetical protein